MSDETRRRIEAMARDGNLDVEDVAHALAAALADGRLDAAEREALQSELATLEPAARAYLEDVLEGRPGTLPNRILLAPHPRGAAQRDLYYARTDVVALQESLGRVGHTVRVDGDYGPGTAAKVSELQAASGLERTGILDSATLAALNERLAASGHPPLDVTPRARLRPDHVVALKRSPNRGDVRAIQQGLIALSSYFALGGIRLEADGAFGARTERAVKAFQEVAYLPQTGIVDTTTLRALNAALASAGLEIVDVSPPEGGAGAHGQVELHFYPGDRELKVYVLQGKRVVAQYGMVGGRPAKQPDANNPRVGYDPTPAGRYEVAGLSPHVSNAWVYSYVPFGSHLREAGGEIQFRDGSGAWKWATGPDGVFRDRDPSPLERDAYLDAGGAVMTTWRLNDFGHIRAMLRDAATGALQSHMMHAAPSDETTEVYFGDTARLLDPAVAKVELGYSHGCERIHPRDLDEMIARGYLAPGTKLVVHGYDETYAAA